jgi:hypothetical protein
MKGLMSISSATKFVSVVGLAAALTWIPARGDDEADHAAAVSAATQQAAHWLDALDSGDYDASWNNVAAVMKEGRHREDWITDVAAPRATLGKPIMRDLKHAEFATTVRGAPEGQYVLATYVTQFANAPPTAETILLTLEGKEWHIAGYNAAPAPKLAPAPALAPPPAPAAPASKAGGGGGKPGT